MRTVAVVSQKGGVGKSTLVRQLAVIAGESSDSYIIDRDPQATAASWHERRQMPEEAPEQPRLIDIKLTPLTEAVERLRERAGFLFVDTRPAVTGPEAEAVRVADIVLVPVRPSPDDLLAVKDTLAMTRRLGKQALLVINLAKNERRAESAARALSAWPERVCPTTIIDRTVYQDAALAGLGVTEMQGAAARAADAEMRALWAWVLEASDE